MKSLFTWPILASALVLMSGVPVSGADFRAVASVDASTPKQPSVPENPAKLWLSAEQVRKDIELAEEVYSRVHPGYDRYADARDLEAAWSLLRKRAQAQGGMTAGDLYLGLQRVLTLIRCDHTKAELPASIADFRNVYPVYLPFRWVWVDGKAFVTDPAAGSGLTFGDQVVSVDGRPIRALVEEVEAYIPVDGYTDWARAGSVAQSLEFRGGAVDHFGSLLNELSPSVDLEVVGRDGVGRKLTSDRITFDGWTALASENGTAANFRDAVKYRSIGGGAGILSVDTFVNYRSPVDPETIFDPVFEQIAEDGIKTLILDLRENGGGSTDASQSLFRHLIAEPAQIKLDMRVRTLDLDGIRDSLSTWEASALRPDPANFAQNSDGTWSILPGVLVDTKVLQPDELAFTGELLILTSASNSSGSTNLSAVLHHLGRAKLIGERTGGSAEGGTAGVLFTLTLPESGIRARVPVFRYFNNVGRFENGMGLNPDIEAATTAQSLLDGSDPAMEAAIAYIEEQKQTSLSSSSPPPTVSAADFTSLIGEWSGTLNYLNFGSSDRSTIPIEATVISVGREGMDYAIRFPGEEQHNGNRLLSLGEDGQSIDGAALISRKLSEEGVLELVTQHIGQDNNKDVMVRMTYAISQNEFSIAKSVQPSPDEPYFNRNRYVFVR